MNGNLEVPQNVLSNLAGNYAIDPATEPQEYRRATCAACGKPMIKMYHCWFEDGVFKKELHLCKNCWKHYAQ